MREMDIESLFEKMSYMDELNGMYEGAWNGFERRIVLRQYYMDAMPEIIGLARQSLNIWASIYPFDWKFNKNEYSLWSSIRSNPMVMYPEFPVLNYFVDFGNPYLRIAIEADSEKYHDREKDLERDKELLRVNWKTFRVSKALNGRFMTLKRTINALNRAPKALDERFKALDATFKTLEGTSKALKVPSNVMERKINADSHL